MNTSLRRSDLSWKHVISSNINTTLTKPEFDESEHEEKLTRKWHSHTWHNQCYPDLFNQLIEQWDVWYENGSIVLQHRWHTHAQHTHTTTTSTQTYWFTTYNMNNMNNNNTQTFWTQTHRETHDPRTEKIWKHTHTRKRTISNTAHKRTDCDPVLLRKQTLTKRRTDTLCHINFAQKFGTM